MTSTMRFIDDAEIVVVGGGPAGSVAAFTLASMGHDVVLIDKHSFPRDKPCGDGHLASASAFLHELGLDHVLTGAHPIDAIRLFVDWREQAAVSIRRRNAPGGGEACCLPRMRLDDALVQAACAAGARLVRGYVTAPFYSDRRVAGVELVQEGGRYAIGARHLIAADGATSRLRRVITGQHGPPPLRAYAVRQYVRSERPFAGAFEAYLPLPNGLAAFGYGWVFPIDAHLANVGLGYLTTRGLPRPPSIHGLLNSFLTGLRGHRGTEFGELECHGPVSGFPLCVNFSPERSEIDGVLFVGDAGHTTDPITGEGVDQAMRSGHAAALALDRAIRRRCRPTGLGPVMAAENLRLGQDAAMIARLARAMLVVRRPTSPTSEDVFRAPPPVLSAAAAMATADVERPSLLDAAAGRLALRLGYGDVMSALDKRLRRDVQTELVLAAELILREICAGVGPIGALTLLASQGACGLQIDDRAVDGGVAVELLCAYPAMLTLVSEGASQQVKASNSLALMSGDHALSRAVTAAARLGPELSGWLGDATVATCEGVARTMQHRYQPQWTVQGYVDSVRLRRGTGVSLAARVGARLAGADDAVVDALGAAAASLGVAVQICEDILALTGRDAVTGRQPRHTLEDGYFTLPIILAVQAEPRLAARLIGRRDRAAWDELIRLIQLGSGLARAAEVCHRYAAEAKEAVVGVLGADSQFAAVCDLPCHCLASVVRQAAAGARASADVATNGLRLAS